MDWLIEEYGFTPTDAYCLVSTCPDFRINVYQMCRLGKFGELVAGRRSPGATWRKKGPRSCERRGPQIRYGV